LLHLHHFVFVGSVKTTWQVNDTDWASSLLKISTLLFTWLNISHRSSCVLFFMALKFNEKFKRFCVLYKDYYFNPYLYEYSYFRIIHKYSTHAINVAWFLVVLLHTNLFTCAIPMITFSLHFSPYAHQS
jgi:hypothetical protein